MSVSQKNFELLLFIADSLFLMDGGRVFCGNCVPRHCYISVSDYITEKIARLLSARMCHTTLDMMIKLIEFSVNQLVYT